MKLPRRGCLVGVDGKLKWAWSHNDPEREFEGLPPITIFEDGSSLSIADPEDTIFDMESILEPEDMAEVHRDHDSLRFRHIDGVWELKVKVMIDGEETEIDHSVQTKIKLRKEKRSQRA